MPDDTRLPPPPEISCAAQPTNELELRLAELKQRIEDNSEPKGPIRRALLPSLRASMDVVAALIDDGQVQIATEVINPVAKEVDRILSRGY